MRSKYAFDKKRGLYYINFETGKRLSNGRKEYKKITSRTIAGLDEKIRKAAADVTNNTVKSSIILDDWFEVWFNTYKSGCKESTGHFYKHLYTCYISPILGSRRVTDITEIQCQNILSEMAKTHAEKTVKEVKVILSSLFGKALKNRLVSENVAAELIVRGKPKKERRALTKEERRVFLQTCSGHSFGLYGLFLYFFGLRRGEALGLCGSDIDLSRNCLTVKRQITHSSDGKPKIETLKTKAGYRTVPIPLKAFEYIDFGSLPKDFIFDENNKHLTAKQFTLRWKSLIDSAFPNGTDITSHTLRHNYCTMLFEAGLSPVEAHRILGHANITTTYAIYTHYSEQIAEQATLKILEIG